jgi:anti-sigma B factor antagonist
MSELSTFDSSFFTLTDDEGIAHLVLDRNQLTEEDNLAQLDQEFSALIDTFHARKVIVDMTAVAYLTSAGVGRLISLHRRLARANGQLVLCSLSKTVSSILSQSNLINYFHVALDAQAARAQFT